MRQHSISTASRRCEPLDRCPNAWALIMISQRLAKVGRCNGSGESRSARGGAATILALTMPSLSSLRVRWCVRGLFSASRPCSPILETQLLSGSSQPSPCTKPEWDRETSSPVTQLTLAKAGPGDTSNHPAVTNIFHPRLHDQNVRCKFDPWSCTTLHIWLRGQRPKPSAHLQVTSSLLRTAPWHVP